MTFFDQFKPELSDCRGLPASPPAASSIGGVTADKQFELSEIPLCGGRCRSATVNYAVRHLKQFEDPALSKIPLSGREGPVILLRRIKMGNPKGLQILNI